MMTQMANIADTGVKISFIPISLVASMKNAKVNTIWQA